MTKDEALREFLEFLNTEYGSEKWSAEHGDPLAPEARKIRDTVVAALSGPGRGEDRVAQLEIALRRCAETFRRYERLHLDKGTDDGHRKSIANADFANMCEKALGIPPIDVEPLPAQEE